MRFLPFFAAGAGSSSPPLLAASAAEMAARAFRNSIGLAPHAYVVQRRLSRALDLVSERKTELAQVALLCGFADQSHFGRAFKARFGLQPSVLRNL